MEDSDRYGGWKRIRFNPTGFFRLEKSARWWLVTPEGNAFLSLGVNHINPDFLFQECNRWHWSDRLGYHVFPFDDASFATSPAYGRWLSILKEDFDRWGFNTIGALSAVGRCPKEIPYTLCIRFVDNCHWMKVEDISFPDVFDAAFADKCRALAQKICGPRRDDPCLVGYFYSDTPILTSRDAHAKKGLFYYDFPRAETPTWPAAIRALPPKAPGRLAYLDFIRQRYPSGIADFNKTYGTSFKGFDDLPRAPRPSKPLLHQRARADDHAFLLRILAKLYQVLHDSIREFDPNHLILGDRYNGNTEIPDAALEAMRKHVDVLSIQYYGHFSEQEADLGRWHAQCGKPVILCDSAFSVPTPEMPNPFGRWVEDQTQRAVAYEAYARAAFSKPYVIGWHWCGYIDRWAASQGFRQHSGIKDAFGVDRPVASTMGRINKSIYQIARVPSDLSR